MLMRQMDGWMSGWTFGWMNKFMKVLACNRNNFVFNLILNHLKVIGFEEMPMLLRILGFDWRLIN